MPTKALTELFVERVKLPVQGRIEYFDAAFGGLALRVTDKGHKSWSLHYRMGGRLRRFTIGTYPAIKPPQARRLAQRALDRVGEGVDPADEKRAKREAAAHGAQTDDFAAVVQDYLARLERNTTLGTHREAKRILEREVAKGWQKRTLTSITRSDVNRVIDAALARGAEVHANRVLTRLRAFFNWAVGRDRLSTSPVAGMRPPTKEQPRDRVLSDDEIRWLWEAAGVVGWPFGSLTKLLLLTAQRRDEVATLEWSELDLKQRNWTMPREKTKNNRGHEVQLSETAIEVLKSIPRISERFVFTTNGESPVSGFSRAKRRLDAEMIRARRRSLRLPEDDNAYRKAIGLGIGKPLPEEIPNWTLHDLRRTGATGMARLNFPPHVVDKIPNHVSGTIREVAAVYNRFEYLEERRLALNAWADQINKILWPAESNVVSFNR